MPEPSYPFVPKSNVHLRPGQFFPIELSDGRFACGRVLGIDRRPGYGSRTNVIVGLLDWIGPDRPTVSAIAGAPVVDEANVPFRAIADSGPGIIGERPLDEDGIEVRDSVRTYAGECWPAIEAEARFVRPPLPPGPDVRWVESPLTPEMLAPMAPGDRVVCHHLTDADARRLGAWFGEHPDVALRLAEADDLELLRHFPAVERCAVMGWKLTSLDGLRHLPETLRTLEISSTRRPLDLSILGRFSVLESLFMEGQTKGIAVLGELTQIEDLTLRSVTLPDLSILLPLDRLRALDLKLGGTSDLGLLPRIGRLEYLELWMIKGLTDLSPIAEVRTLRYLFLESLRRVEQLPDPAALAHLRRVHLQNMKGLTDLTPLASAPALTDLVLWDMGHLDPEALRCLVGHPTLRAADLHLGSRRRTEAAEQLLGLPEAEGGKLPWRTVVGP